MNRTGFPFKAVLFDWAHTLVDLMDEDDRVPLELIHDHLAGLGFTVPDFQKFYDTYHDLFFGMIEISRVTHREARFDHVLQYLLAQNDIHLNGKVRLQDLLKMYYEKIYSRRRVFPEVIETLASLKNSGIAMAVVSNTTNPGSMKDYEQTLMGLDSYFQFSIYSSEVPYRKPHPSIFQLALDRLNMKPEEVLFVGDNLRMDVQGAQSVGMKAAWLNRKGRALTDPVEPDYTLQSLAEILKLPQVS
ncbi:MAG: HAD-IIIA family hydrolase [Nitrospinaceae bacterium]|nr:HAD family hydrolase [Nitrospinaceae bacterium]NIR57374.1 HAD family hydrolase [Nitrospinaceae bacterium]NIS87826.1 HAD family hydrolase [Nitrospinaceae bacterium]NIT84696.1 HAD family hydrolase [Nitrospinaceae bacterium]NIU46875.1 HAD family hydrolase [Nitrospinaceae bacterium]